MAKQDKDAISLFELPVGTFSQCYSGSLSCPGMTVIKHVVTAFFTIVLVYTYVCLTQMGPSLGGR